MTQGSLLAFSILMMIPAVMVFLSLALKPTVNRWANIILGVLYTFVNISNLIGETWAYYIVFGVVEIVLTFLIVWYAWKWRNPRADEARIPMPSALDVDLCANRLRKGQPWRHHPAVDVL